MKYLRFSLLAGWLLLASTSFLQARNLIVDPTFEAGVVDWKLFAPADSKQSNCRFTITTDSPHSGINCAQLQSDQFARFGIVPDVDFTPTPGEHYHVSAWVKAGPNTEVQPGSPGILIRIGMIQNGKDSPGGHFFLGLNNAMTRGTMPPPPGKLPTEWTKLEGDFTFPGDANVAILYLFAWGIKGPVYFDDVSLEKVP